MSGGDELLTRLRAASGEARSLIVEEIVRERLAIALKVDPASIQRRTPFYQLGVDSMMLIEIRTGLERRLGVAISTIELINHPTIEQLAARLLDTLGVLDAATGLAPAAPEPAPVPDVDISDLGDLAGVSAVELAELLGDDSVAGENR